MSTLDTLLTNLDKIYDEVTGKVLPENIKQGVNLFGVDGTIPTNVKTYATVDEMQAATNVKEDDYAIVYGTTYVGTYRYDNGAWTQIGDSTDEQKIMDVLNGIADTADQYEGTGGTDEEINEVLDNIIGGTN